MTTQRPRDYDHTEFLLSNPSSVRAAQFVGNLKRVPMEASGTQEVPLPANPMKRGRKRFQFLSHRYNPARSRNNMVQHATNMRQKLAEADEKGFYTATHGQWEYAADSEWVALIHRYLHEIGERLEALNQRFSYEVLDIDPVEPLPALAEDDTHRQQQRPPADIPRTVEQLTDTVVIAPGAPARA